jgi:hypothetical protein
MSSIELYLNGYKTKGMVHYLEADYINFTFCKKAGKLEKYTYSLKVSSGGTMLKLLVSLLASQWQLSIKTIYY